MNYKDIISRFEESKHLISMVSPERILELGYNIGLSKGTNVLDLCCGYGEMLRLWNEAYEITGTGVDRVPEFIATGNSRVNRAPVTLVCGDVLKYTNNAKFDVVLCTEFTTELFESFEVGIHFLEKFVKPGGTLIFGRLYAKTENPPQELIDFDGELLTLSEIWRAVKQCGYHFTAMATDTDTEWERYIMRGAKEAIEHLREKPEDKKFTAWDDKWYRIYFEQRRQYEGWGMFAIQRL